MDLEHNFKEVEADLNRCSNVYTVPEACLSPLLQMSLEPVQGMVGRLAMFDSVLQWTLG